jgi:hypothetical protein
MSSFRFSDGVGWSTNRSLFRRLTEDLISEGALPQEVDRRFREALETMLYHVSLEDLDKDSIEQLRTAFHRYRDNMMEGRPADFPGEELYVHYLTELREFDSLLQQIQ